MEDPWRAERHFGLMAYARHGVVVEPRAGQVGRRGRGAVGQMAGVSIRPWPAGGVGKEDPRSASWRVDETGRGETGQTGSWTDGRKGRGQVAVGRQRHGCGWLMEATATAITGGDYCSKLPTPPGRGLRGDLPMSHVAILPAPPHLSRRPLPATGGQSWQWPVWRRPACPKIPYPGAQVPRYPQSPPMQVLLSRRLAAAVVVVMAVAMVAGVSLSAATCACPSTRSRPAVT
jgi:hypothetical protein